MAAAKSYPSSLLINVEDLLKLRGVESQRVEFKKSWNNQKGTKGGSYWQVIHTITAFANDLYNVNGGYIIIGVEEEKDQESPDNRQVIFPPFGVQGNLDRMQKEILGACRENIEPVFIPILQPEVVADKKVLVIWVGPSDNRPHTCRESHKADKLNYYIREGTETKKAKKGQISLLLQHKAPPFDDRKATNTELGTQLNENSIDLTLVQQYLKNIDSALVGQEMKPIHLYEKLQLVYPVTEQMTQMFRPRNVALLFFHPDPHKFFKGASTEIAIFTQDNETKEELVTGPIDQQIKKCLRFILDFPKKESCHAMVAYPERALREAVVNAFHHRSYESCHPDRVKIHIKPKFIDIISYPGPDPCLKQEDFSGDNEVPPVPSRNRRIADFLKSLKLAEGRYTGVATIFRSMKENNNPRPKFDFKSSYFRVRLPGHPKYIVHSIRSRVENLCAKGDKVEAVRLITGFLEENPTIWSETLIDKLFVLLGEDQNDAKYHPYHEFIEVRRERRGPIKDKLLKWSETDVTDIPSGVKLVKSLVEEGAGISDLQCVVSKASHLCQKNADGEHNLEALQKAYKLYEAMGEVVQTDASVSFQFADCLFNMYVLNTTNKRSETGERSRSEERQTLLPFLVKAEDYVKTAIQLTPKDARQTMSVQYRLLGYIHFQRCSIDKSFEKDVRDCYCKALLLYPKIYIAPEFSPESSPLQNRCVRSAGGRKKGHQISDSSEKVIGSWPEIANPRRKKEDCPVSSVLD
ncbi:hypothetical protein AWC38_SpisGene11647 [Stylophora pistillata]|uniref:Schlafen AlbA-2 domain-containing protein n=1 Tax=Stylophora pistillata TaxID=50429 RepID=A0A2B4S4Q7_STYPI|nr:hypothetical protein AWC38_SpisGene11647 [Stylophora pistillata]